MAAIDIAREAVAHKERAWFLYDEITALMPSRGTLNSTSSDDLERFLDLLSMQRNDIPHVYRIYEILRERRETGFEPDGANPLELGGDTLMRIGDLAQEWHTAEREFSSLSYDILKAVQAEGLEAAEEVMAILPPSGMRYEVGAMMERMSSAAALTP